MSGIVILYAVYAVVLLAGGVMGYARARSVPSLAAGIVSGVLAAVAAVLLDLHHPRSGLGLGIALSLGMAVFFLGRFRRTGKAMPAMPVIAVSALVLILSLVRLLAAPGRPA